MLSRSQLNQLAETLRGIPVWGCLPGSQAQRAGVRYGDILLSVNGVPTSDVGEYVRARALRKGGVQLVIFRDGVELSLELTLDASEAREPTRAELEAVSAEIVAARMLPTERPPPASDETLV
jgi:C-terminal processing protease CtpA/Prc